MIRLYRALLRLYPRGFRQDYGDELCRTFAERTRGLPPRKALVAALTDVIPNALGVRWDNLRHGVSGGFSLPSVGGDIRLALRHITRAPLFSGVLIVVIALGIGINTGLLTALNSVAWRPAPGIALDQRLARLTPMASPGQRRRPAGFRFSYPEIQDLRERRDVFSDVAAWEWGRIAVDFGAGAESMDVSYTTANYFRILGVVLAAGPGFPDGVDLSAAPMVVIGHSLWMTHFGGSPDAIGKTIRVMNLPFTIVGVAPPQFVGTSLRRLGSQSIWIPLGARATVAPVTRDDLGRREAASLESVARLASGLHPGDVRRRTAILATRLAGMEPEHSDTRELIFGFLFIAALVVLITCTNVSALLLGRAVARRREIGVRLALGASRTRIVRQMLTESLVLASAGALLGVVLYIAVIKIAYATIPDVVVYGLEPTPATFLFAAVFALVATLTFGLAPALHASKAGIGEVIKNSGGLQIRRSRLQAGFVVIQLASSMPALVVTSLVLIDMRRGMNDSAAPASVVTMYSEVMGRPATANATFGRVRQRLAAIRGVQSVGIDAPFAVIYGQQEPPSFGPGPRIQQHQVTADYFASLGVPLLRGRAIGAGDDQPGSVAAVVDEEVAQRLWPRGDALGKQLVRRAEPDGETTALTVIGVAGRAPYDDVDRAPRVYVPFATGASLFGVSIAVRTLGEARPFVPVIRAAIHEVEPLATVGSVSTLAEQYADRRRDAIQSNLAAFAVGAAVLLLASLGLYAIIAFAVAQRTREIGVRLAIGATSGDVVRQFFSSGLKVTAVGLAIGLPLTVAGILVVKASLIGFSVRNITAVMLVVPVLILIAGLASWLPARRAGRVDPLDALRSE